jgi:MFS transporter, DHA3 family, macrolide efflux protein
MRRKVNKFMEAPKNMKTFLVVWIGQVLSIIGSGMTGFALGVWIFQQTGQATPFALVVLFSSLPRIFLSPLAGSLADRWNRRWLMIAADCGSALSTLALVFLLFGGRLEIWHIYLMAAVSSSFSAFQGPAYSASIAMLVPKQHLGRANGLVQMAQAMEMLVAPLLAGTLFLLVGLRGIILIDFFTFFFALGTLLLVRIPQPALSEAEGGTTALHGRVWKDAVFGWNYLRSRPGLFGLLLYFAGVNFLLNFSAVLTGPMVLSFAEANVLGMVQMSMGLGMLAGSVAMSAWGGPSRRVRAIFMLTIPVSAGLILAGILPLSYTIMAGMFLFLLPIPLASGMSAVIFQSKVAPAVQGRVFAIRSMISTSMMPLAFLLAGPLADRIFEPLMAPGGGLSATFLASILGTGPGRGIGLLFVIAGSVLIVLSGLAYLNPRIRNLESELPDAAVEAAGSHYELAASPAPAD